QEQLAETRDHFARKSMRRTAIAMNCLAHQMTKAGCLGRAVDESQVRMPMHGKILQSCGRKKALI
ncbi:unnamed protein product, partial [Amoebophrya sp. A25]